MNDRPDQVQVVTRKRSREVCKVCGAERSFRTYKTVRYADGTSIGYAACKVCKARAKIYTVVE